MILPEEDYESNPSLKRRIYNGNNTRYGGYDGAYITCEVVMEWYEMAKKELPDGFSGKENHYTEYDVAEMCAWIRKYFSD